jgi:hypothetical protein
VGAELFRADGQLDGRTDMTKLIVDFRNFANAPDKNEKQNPEVRIALAPFTMQYMPAARPCKQARCSPGVLWG